MNKKWLKLGVPLTAGAVLLLVSGFTANAGTSGYELYKEALKANANVSGVTADVSFTVNDNGRQDVKADAKMKLDKDAKAASGSVLLEGEGTQPQTLEVFHQDGRLMVRNEASDIVYRLDSKSQGDTGAQKWRQNNTHAGPPKELVPVVDALLGNLKQQVEATDQSDGTRLVSLHLSGSRVPAVVDALGSMMIKHAGEANGTGMRDGWSKPSNGTALPEGAVGEPAADNPAELLLGGQWKPQLPQLALDIRVEAINIDAVIGKDNRLQHQTVQLTFAGKSEDGTAHEVTVTADAAFSGYDSTTPDRIDLTGKQVKDIEPPAHRDWQR